MAPANATGSRLVRVATVLALALSAFARPALAEGGVIRVFMDHARIIKLDRPISKVIIGSAEVADVVVADANTIVVTGRSYGTTNLVIMDTAGEPIVDERILVSVDEANTLRVFKQTDRSVYSCSPSCEEHVKRGAGG